MQTECFLVNTRHCIQNSLKCTLTCSLLEQQTKIVEKYISIQKSESFFGYEGKE